MGFGGRFGRKKLDRGQRVHGAKWQFVTPALEMINYAQLKEQLGELEFKVSRKAHPEWLLFKSRKEALRWIGLCQMQSGGKIRNLARQVPFTLDVIRPDGEVINIGKYIADHVYERADLGKPLDDWPCHFLPPAQHCHPGAPQQLFEDGAEHSCGIEIEGQFFEVTWRRVVEDVKGYKEDLYIWKRRHLEAQYGIVLEEV